MLVCRFPILSLLRLCALNLFWIWGKTSHFLVTYRLFGFKIPKLLFLNKYLSV